VTTTLHTADLVVPVSSPPIPNGAVVVDGAAIVGVGGLEEMRAAHPAGKVTRWEGTMVPGLVNAHTHLQYTSFATVGASRHASYVHWSEAFVQEYDLRRGEDWGTTARAGIEQGLRAGVTAYGDVVTDVAAMTALSDSGVAGVAYYEIIGVPLEKWQEEVKDRVTAILTSTPTSVEFRVGLSPHTPYTVDEPVLIDAADLARRLGVRLHVHLAEVDSEDDYYRTGTGPLVERITMRVGRPWSVVAQGGSGMGAAEYARHCGLVGPDSHMAHGVYLDEEGREILDRAGTYVALCPRSNLTVGGESPPVADYLRENRRIAVGTDSLGSSQSLDLLEDVSLLAELAAEGGYDRPDLEERLLHAATQGGAAALGLEDVVGSLEPGKRADFAVFAVGSVSELVSGGSGTCVGTVTGGATRWRG
jgi:aminodeoxyfutalosine deaminase